MQPLLLAMMLVNLSSVGWRDRASGLMMGFYFVSAGAIVLVAARKPAIRASRYIRSLADACRIGSKCV